MGNLVAILYQMDAIYWFTNKIFVYAINYVINTRDIVKNIWNCFCQVYLSYYTAK